VRTNIDIDDGLMRQAMRATGERTKRAVVDRALRLLVQTRGQTRIRRLRGKITWRGDLNGRLLKISDRGGAPQTICSCTPTNYGTGAWNNDSVGASGRGVDSRTDHPRHCRDFVPLRLSFKQVNCVVDRRQEA